VANVRIEIIRGGDQTGLRVIVDNEIVTTGEYGGEPEDNCEYRDYAWVKESLAELARKLGAQAEIVNHEVDVPGGSDLLLNRSWQEYERAQRNAYYEAMAKAPAPSPDEGKVGE